MSNPPTTIAQTKLARRIGLPLLTFYGLGTILGAGIYVLVGKVAGSAGLLSPLAFLVAAIVAAITALSYCQLVMRFPKSAGEAYYVEQAFQQAWFSAIMGYLVIFTGIVSASTLANGFVGYLSSFISAPRTTIIVLVVATMGLIALWGIAESLWLAALITILEIVGLIIVITLGADSLATLPEQWSSLIIPLKGTEWLAVMSGAFLAFYAFIGFEDMVNVVEEVKQPHHTMPRAILLALLISSLLYLLVAFIAVLGMPIEALAKSDAPLRDLLETRHPTAGQSIAIISLFAIINGVLIQIIMASRVLYGMADQGRSLRLFSKVSSITHTPWLATLTVALLVLFFSLWLPLVALAKTTSFIILVIFTFVNIALWSLLKHGDIQQEQQLPCWPKLGAALCISLLILQVYTQLN